MGYTAAPSIHTSIWQLSVHRLYRQSSLWIDLEAKHGRPYRLRHRFVAGGVEPQKGGGLARAWTTCRSEGARHQCPDEAPAAHRRQWPRSSDFASFLLLLLTCHILPDKHNSALSCLANNLWEVYPHENRSKFIEISSLYNARYTCDCLTHICKNYCKASN